MAYNLETQAARFVACEQTRLAWRAAAQAHNAELTRLYGCFGPDESRNPHLNGSKEQATKLAGLFWTRRRAELADDKARRLCETGQE